jgi:hypothetical protein
MLSRPIQTHMPSVAQLLISIFGLASTVILMVATGLLIALNGKMTTQETQQLSAFAWISVFISLLALPSLILSIRRLSRKTLPQSNPKRLLSIAGVLLIPLSIIAFLWSKSTSNQTSSFVSIILTVFLVMVPLWWLVEFGRNQLNPGSPQRQWGLVSFGIFVTLPIVILFEIVAIAFGIGLGIAWFTQQPEFTPILMQVQTQMRIAPQELPNITEQLIPLLQKPGVIVAGFFLISILIPLIEELLKPLAIWFFMKRNWSPVDGFTAGLLCGATFALVESIMALVAVPNDVWFMTMIARVGTGLLHTLTTGLTGWALTSTWRDGKYLRIGLIYLTSVTIHGVWNFLALLMGLGTNLDFLTLPSLKSITSASPWILITITIFMITLLFAMNRKLREEQVPPGIPSLTAETIE